MYPGTVRRKDCSRVYCNYDDRVLGTKRVVPRSILIHPLSTEDREEVPENQHKRDLKSISRRQRFYRGINTLPFNKR